MSYDDQLILTTRSAEYAAAGMQVFAASVITPDPLKSAAIADYIKACLPPDPGEAWRAVLKTIQSNAAAPSPAPLPRHSAYGSSDRSTSPPVPTPDRWQIRQDSVSRGDYLSPAGQPGRRADRREPADKRRSA